MKNSKPKSIEEKRARAREASREWRRKNPEKVREAKREWKRKNPGKVREARREWKREWKRKNPEKVREAKRRYNANRRIRELETAVRNTLAALAALAGGES